jgi:hypothetical protein
LKESYQPLLKLSFLEKETDEIIGKQTLPQSSYHIDIQLIERFIKDPETCIKKHFLNIKEAQEVNNKDVSERHLNLWKLQQELNKDSHCDSFAQVDDYKHLKFDFPESKHLRSNLFSDEDHLQNQMILKPLIIYLANDVSLQCLGISTIELEKKIKKNEKLILKFFELKTLISKR